MAGMPILPIRVGPSDVSLYPVAMAWGLMGLAFRSSREGFDQRAVDLSDLNLAPPAAKGDEDRDTAGS